MTDITHGEARDLIPEILHGTVDENRRRAIEAHLASCSECASEMRVLQMVKDAPSFAPVIDASRVASAIVPYAGILPERPRAAPRYLQLAVAITAVALVGVTMFVRSASPPVVTTPPAHVVSAPPAAASPATPSPETPSVASAAISPSLSSVGSPARQPSRELQAAAGLDGLSDVSVAQLMREIDGLDGLPSSEPETLGVGDPTTGREGGQ